ncbi:carbohydrate Esterase Family 12 protein [Lachnospira eligens CAG:72]|jgi:lysophospholipase L1-like esterase|uniref:Carbohydrate Esterase Family 12 protein n=1 Tax=Lachnospira eligens CAG:72 TaxID=1263077 RepID=R5ZYX0_9FIRM|nr:carbohydrate Esterase Family 12 protein [[Eubacterium] eligens CAG:72]
MNIYLAGDSIVQNYTEEEFIAGWGQFLPRFFKSDVNVFNYAKGGRSSRLFINEGRFEEIDRHIQSGDYLFIEFCHNDDDSKDYKSMFNRQTPLGVPDESGRFPVIAGVKMLKNYIPPEYIEDLNNDDSITDKQAVLNSVLAINQSYPYDTYYPYSKDASMGSYKWFIKQFIDMARKHDAVPVLVTAPARTFFNDDGTIMDAPGCHGGNNFSYIRAMRQIGEETGTPVLDLFSYSVELFEKIGHDNIHRYTSIKKGINKGKWPDDFLKELAKPETVSENTHFNKDGAMLITKGLVELILKSKNPQLCELQSALLHNVL